MHKFLFKTIKATIISLIVALLIVIITVLAVEYFFGAEIESAIMYANMVSVSSEKRVPQEVVMGEANKIDVYPEYGAKYATIEIPKIDKSLPVYFGDSLDILKNGVGHYTGSYFPGEGGSIIYMGHNSKSVFRRFSELQIGNEIYVTTSYGKYTYRIYDMQLIKETEGDKLKIQSEKEILMVYTCYPFVNIGHATQRYVVFAELINAEEGGGQ